MNKMRERIIFANHSCPFCLDAADRVLPSASSGTPLWTCELPDPRLQFAGGPVIKLSTSSKRHLSDG